MLRTFLGRLFLRVLYPKTRGTKLRRLVAMVIVLLAGPAQASVCRWDDVDTWTCALKGEAEEYALSDAARTKPLTAASIVSGGGDDSEVTVLGLPSDDGHFASGLDVTFTFDEAIRRPHFPPKELMAISVTNDPIWRDHLPGDVVPLCLFYQERRVVVNPCR